MESSKALLSPKRIRDVIKYIEVVAARDEGNNNSRFKILSQKLYTYFGLKFFDFAALLLSVRLPEDAVRILRLTTVWVRGCSQAMNAKANHRINTEIRNTQ